MEGGEGGDDWSSWGMRTDDSEGVLKGEMGQFLRGKGPRGVLYTLSVHGAFFLCRVWTFGRVEVS